MMTNILPRAAAILLVLALATVPSAAQPDFWTQTSGPRGANISYFASYPPGHYIVRINWNLYVSQDSGMSWSHIDPGLAKSFPLSMAFDSAGRLYLGVTDGRILRSLDFGATWKDFSLLPDGTPVWSMAFDAGGMYASGLEIVFRSGDSGATWERIAFDSASGSEQTNLWVQQFTGNRPGWAIAMNTDGPYVLDTSHMRFRQTADTHGLNWRNITDIPGGAWYAATDRGVWRSDNPRGNWVPAGLQERAVGMVIGTRSGDLVAYGGAEMFLSHDGGGTWETLPASALDTPAKWLALLDDSHVMAVIRTGLRIVDARTGAIDPTNRGPFPDTVAALAGEPGGVLYAAATGPNGWLYRTADRGLTWHLLPSSPVFTTKAALAVRPGGTIVAIADTTLLVSRDSGATWRRTAGISEWVDRLVPAPNGVLLAFGPLASVFLRSADDGETWNPVSTAIFGTNRPYEVAVLADSSLLLATETRLYHSTDGGISWEPGTRPAFYDARLITAPDGALYLLGTESYRSEDLGRTWIPLPQLPIPVVPTAAAAGTGGRLYVSFKDGGYNSNDAGATWHAVNADPGTYVIAALTASDGTLYGATRGRGVLRHSETSAVPRPGLPGNQEMIVSMAPMPASGRACITLLLPRAGAPTLKLYDVRGVIVAHSQSEPQPAGPVHLELDCMGLPAGVYILQAICNGASCTRPVVVEPGTGW